jgi:hypothetical protein
LPVFGIALQAMKLPLINWRAFFRLGCIALGVNFFSALFAFATMTTPLYPPNRSMPHLNPVNQVITSVLSLASLIVAVPFEIGWIRLTLEGANSVVNRPIWTFKRTEWLFLLATLVLGFLAVAIATVPAFVAVAFSRSWIAPVVSGVGVVILIICAIVATVRLSFIYVEIALQRCNGLASCWNQTRGNFWRLIGIAMAAALPYFIIGLIEIVIGRLSGSVTLPIVGDLWWTLVMLMGMTASWSALALAYKFTGPAPEADAAAAIATS